MIVQACQSLTLYDSSAVMWSSMLSVALAYLYNSFELCDAFALVVIDVK